MTKASSKRTVVILLSDKRSGSTMFQSELCKHSSIQTVGYSSHTYLETHHWTKAAVLLDRPADRHADGVAQSYGSKKNARLYMEDTIVKNCPDFEVPENDRDLVFKGWEAMCDRFAQPVFFEKSPQLLAHWGALELMLEWMGSTSYDVKIIGLVRNPLSVQYSAYQLFHTAPVKRQFGWMEIQKNLLKIQERLGPDRFKLVKYEDIIAKPSEQFVEICHFIGVDPSPQLGGKAHDHSLLKWKEDPYFTLKLDPMVMDVAEQLGYSSEEMINPDKPEPPLSYKLKKRVKAARNRLVSRLYDRLIKPLKLRFNK